MHKIYTVTTLVMSLHIYSATSSQVKAETANWCHKQTAVTQESNHRGGMVQFEHKWNGLYVFLT